MDIPQSRHHLCSCQIHKPAGSAVHSRHILVRNRYQQSRHHQSRGNGPGGIQARHRGMRRLCRNAQTLLCIRHPRRCAHQGNHMFLCMAYNIQCTKLVHKTSCRCLQYLDSIFYLIRRLDLGFLDNSHHQGISPGSSGRCHQSANLQSSHHYLAQ